MKIPLSRGVFAVVDKADFREISKYRWHAVKIKERQYAVRNIGRAQTEYMHRLILGATETEMVDHRDLNSLNNRRKNLRKCTYAQNNANRKARTDAPYGYKGVRRKHHRFQAYITVNKVQIHLGYHSTARNAAVAYDCAAKKYFGEFARTNFKT